jgi:hypothetical protein
MRRYVGNISELGIGIEEPNAGINIPVSIISVQYQTKKMLGCVGLVQYWIGPGIVSFFPLYSGTGLVGCRTVRHVYTSTHTDMDMDWDIDMQHGDKNIDMQHGNGHAPWTLASSMDVKISKKSLFRRH